MRWQLNMSSNRIVCMTTSAPMYVAAKATSVDDLRTTSAVQRSAGPRGSAIKENVRGRVYRRTTLGCHTAIITAMPRVAHLQLESQQNAWLQVEKTTGGSCEVKPNAAPACRLCSARRQCCPCDSPWHTNRICAEVSEIDNAIVATREATLQRPASPSRQGGRNPPN